MAGLDPVVEEADRPRVPRGDPAGAVGDSPDPVAWAGGRGLAVERAQAIQRECAAESKPLVEALDERRMIGIEVLGRQLQAVPLRSLPCRTVSAVLM